MTLLHCDSFESYDPNDLDKTLHRVFVASSGVLETTFAKTGSQCVKLWYNQSCGFSSVDFVNNRAFVGVHFYTTSVVTHILMAFNNENNVSEASLGIVGGYLTFYRGLGTTVLATGSIQLQANTWYHIDVKVTIANSTAFGDVIIRVNEVTDIELGAGQDTSGANLSLRKIVLYNNTTGAYNYYDNFYVCNDQGSYNNTFLGECVVECLRPNADGNSSQFDGSDGNQINNYLLVDDIYPDDTAEYVEAQNLNEKDLYGMSNLSIGAASVKGIRVVTAMQRTAPGQRFMRHVIRSQSTDYEGDELTMPDGDWAYGSNIWEINPYTGVAWVEGDIGTLECGMKVST